MKSPLLYTLLFYLLLPIIILRLLWRSLRAPLYRRRWAERFGFCPINKPERPVLWLHTVSVGETIAAKPLVDVLLKRHPEYDLLITTMTPTGSAQVVKQFESEIKQEKIFHTYIPYDLPDCISRFLNNTKPQLAIFMETEVWPNIISVCQRKNIATILVNARLSERSFNGYQRFAWLTGPVFANISAIAVQNIDDSVRLNKLGVEEAVVTGSLKSEITISDKLHTTAGELKKGWSLDGQRQVIIAASTHAGEDEIVLNAYKKVLKRFPSLLLILVPRHPERFTSVYQLCLEQGCSTQQRSTLSAVAADTQVVVGDTMGELMLLYGTADLAIIGGSFIASGGHNMLEPAAWGLPIITGPSIFNFAKIVEEMTQKNGLLLVKDESDLAEQWTNLLEQPQKLNAIGDNARQYVERNRGALEKTMGVIGAYLN